MGFKKPKTRKTNKNPLEDDKIERDLDPGKVLSGGRKITKKRNKKQQGSDAPKAFQHIMRFMEMKQQNDESKQKLLQGKRKVTKHIKGEPQSIIEDLNIMAGESLSEFDYRVKQKMYNNLRLVGTKYEEKEKYNLNPSRDDGDEVIISKRTERKRRNDVIRKQRRLAKKHKEEDVIFDKPKFGEQAEAPPIFKTLPKERFKKPIPLPNSSEEKNDKKLREDQALKNMIQRTARLSPLDRLQAKRKTKQSDSAAEKRIADVEREKAIRRYRMLRAARDSTATTPKN
ncbi:hypothetical protein COEREDRAFT_81434 [Coemansia reversa NRRL 1564]|uniref:Coiled-coil domain-containing protein 137 n=1 Tax=Coemansia reversa (strain ATCC 12441 / NRRL 1564) TaxID=763665 RepID=A0A2G5BB35_COERN|nr:hypothetical protein COEREDRAFT_81434 [Coemansia reversa NRRL 1564]|eukprot:PIA16221.1 hypothetical protein COEREDRAFT_81434 [Coemansia reversa NRRL 1564]